MKDVGKSKVYGKTLTAEYGNTINGEEKEELNDKSLMNRAAILRADDRHASRGLYIMRGRKWRQQYEEYVATLCILVNYSSINYLRVRSTI